mmetsp:Transcript_8408/g.21498  ORF Transcript_8408/g.21498 Transcript_8408/m.21498 type:complete len:239 (-) Transcript_8408:1338-2054(-)
MHSHGQRLALVGNRVDVSEDVDREAADRRQENFQVCTSHQVGVHAASLLEETLAQNRLGQAESDGQAGQVPHRFDGNLDAVHVQVCRHHFAVNLQPSLSHSLVKLCNGERGGGDGDGGLQVDAFLRRAREAVDHLHAPRVETADLRRVAPRRLRPDSHHGLRGRQLEGTAGGEETLCDRASTVNCSGARVNANGVAKVRLGESGNNRPPGFGGGGGPVQRQRVSGEGGEGGVGRGRVG